MLAPTVSNQLLDKRELIVRNEKSPLEFPAVIYLLRLGLAVSPNK